MVALSLNHRLSIVIHWFDCQCRRHPPQGWASTRGGVSTLGLGLLCLTGLIVGCGLPQPGEIVLTNGGFEDWPVGDAAPTGWTMVGGGGFYKMSPTGSCREGTRAVAFGGSGGQVGLASALTSPRPGTVMRFEGWLQVELDKEAEVLVSLRQRNVDPWSIDLKSDAGNWRKFAMYDVAGRVPLTASVHLKGEGLVRIDDLRVQSLGQVKTEYEIEGGHFDQPWETPVPSGWDRTGPASSAAIGWATDANTPEADGTLPRQSNGWVTIRGANGWCNLERKRNIPLANHIIVFKARVKPVGGRAYLRADYYRGNTFIESRWSATVSADDVSTEPRELRWIDLVLLASQPIEGKADSVKLALVGHDDEGPFEVGFDAVNQYVCDKK